MELTEKEIIMRIRLDEGRIERNAERIAELKADTDAIRRMIAFWKRELKRVKGGKRKTA